MNRRRVIILAALALGALGYEIDALKDPVTGDTISEVVWALSRSPIFILACGILIGHFFWNSKTGKPQRKD